MKQLQSPVCLCMCKLRHKYGITENVKSTRRSSLFFLNKSASPNVYRERTSIIPRFDARLKRTKANSPIWASITPTCNTLKEKKNCILVSTVWFNFNQYAYKKGGPGAISKPLCDHSSNGSLHNYNQNYRC